MSYRDRYYELLEKFKGGQKSPFYSPQEQMREQMMPMQQVRGTQIVGERTEQAKPYGYAEEEKLPEVPTTTMQPEGLTPRTAEAFAKPRPVERGVPPQELLRPLANKIDRMVQYHDVTKKGYVVTEQGMKRLTKEERDYVGAVAAKDAIELVLWYGGPAQAALSNLRALGKVGVQNWLKPQMYRLLDKIKPQGMTSNQVKAVVEKINTPGAVFTAKEKELISSRELAKGLRTGALEKGMKVAREVPKPTAGFEELLTPRGFLGTGGVPANIQNMTLKKIGELQSRAGITIISHQAFNNLLNVLRQAGYAGEKLLGLKLKDARNIAIEQSAKLKLFEEPKTLTEEMMKPTEEKMRVETGRWTEEQKELTQKIFGFKEEKPATVRPVKIGREKVVTEKTEGNIAKLKDHYMRQGEMTEESFKKILQLSGVVDKVGKPKQPAYVDEANYITEKEGKAILRRMHDTAPMIKLSETMNQAVAKDPEIALEVDTLNKRIRVPEGKELRPPSSLESMRYYVQQLDRITGMPLYLMYKDMIDSHSLLLTGQEMTRHRLKMTSANFEKIAKDEKALKRVSDYIAAKGTAPNRPKAPHYISSDEKELADGLSTILDEYKLRARLARFMDYYETGSNRYLPDYDNYSDEIEKAVDIYDTKGMPALVDYLKTQEWGVIKSGYEPHEMVAHPSPSSYTFPPAATGTGHIKVRSELYYAPQMRNILQRFNAYIKQMDTLSIMRPKIRAFVSAVSDGLDKVQNKKVARRIADELTNFLYELRGFGYPRGFFDRMISRLYAQAMKTIIMPSPVLSFRNLMQNPAFAPDKSILFDPRNKPLSDADKAYIDTYVLQTKQMIDDFFLGYQKALPGLGNLTKMVEKVKLYPLSDIANRQWAFWAKINQLRRVWGEGISLKKKMAKTGFDSMSSIEQKTALGILARDGEDAMFRYVAKTYSDDQNFLYERAQRSPAEMGPVGKIIGNLFLFPRAFWERLARAASQLTRGNSHRAKWRGLKLIFATLAGGMAMNQIYEKITGRRFGPYNPLLLARMRPGGLMWSSIDQGTTTFNDMVGVLQGNKKAFESFAVSLPRTNEMFIPFYAYFIRAIEAATDMKNIDRMALRKMRDLIDKEYKIRGGAYKVDRNAMQSWQYFFSGRQVDYKQVEKSIQDRAQEEAEKVIKRFSK